MSDYKVLIGDCVESMRTLPDQSVNCCITSPPYFGLRDYGQDGQIGLESTPDEYVAALVAVFREVRRVLRDDGTLWLNLGDSYATGTKAERQPGNKSFGEGTSKAQGVARIGTPEGLKTKDLIGIPWRVAFALQADGWYLRQDIIWHKPNPMPESVRDRCTKSHEYIFMLSKSPKYYYDHEAVKEPANSGPAGTVKKDQPRKMNATPVYQTNRGGISQEPVKQGAMGIPTDGKRNRRSVWTVSTKPYPGAHFATFPPDLIEPCILAGCPPAGKRCDCSEIINTPTGSGPSDDPTMSVGRSGMNRQRRANEGTRPITKAQQRHNAAEIRSSQHKAEMREIAGTAFNHYVRTDAAGARPLPDETFKDWLSRGWITEAPPCKCPIKPAGTVLDPFGGSGTTAGVAVANGRNAVICELSPDYGNLIPDRVSDICGKADFKRETEKQLDWLEATA